MVLEYNWSWLENICLYWWSKHRLYLTLGSDFLAKQIFKAKEMYTTEIIKRSLVMMSFVMVIASKLEGKRMVLEGGQTAGRDSLLRFNNSWLTELSWPWNVPSVGLLKPGPAHLGQRSWNKYSYVCSLRLGNFFLVPHFLGDVTISHIAFMTLVHMCSWLWLCFISSFTSLLGWVEVLLFFFCFFYMTKRNAPLPWEISFSVIKWSR